MFGVRLWHRADVEQLDWAIYEAMKRAADQAAHEAAKEAR